MSHNEVSGKEVCCQIVFHLLIEVLLCKWVIIKKNLLALKLATLADTELSSSKMWQIVA